MELVSLSPFPALLLPWEADAGQASLTVVVKVTVQLVHEADATVAEAQLPIAGDEAWDDGPTASLHHPSDRAPLKPRTDLVLVGHAYAPGGSKVEQLVASVRVGDFQKAITVTATRLWTMTGGGFVPGPPVPFEKMPLRHERAALSPDNPVGVDPAAPPAPGAPVAANLEPVAPATFGCFAPIAASWRPRRRLLGDAGRFWALSFETGARSPEPAPRALDFRYFNAAPPDQQTSLLRQRADIELVNLHPKHPVFRTRLPPLRPQVFRLDPRARRPVEIALRCDTLWIDADRSLACLVWRGLTDVPSSSPEAIGTVLVVADPQGRRVRWEQAERAWREGVPIEATEPAPEDALAMRHDKVRLKEPDAEVASERQKDETRAFDAGTSGAWTAALPFREEPRAQEASRADAAGGRSSALPFQEGPSAQAGAGAQAGASASTSTPADASASARAGVGVPAGADASASARAGVGVPAGAGSPAARHGAPPPGAPVLHPPPPPGAPVLHPPPPGGAPPLRPRPPVSAPPPRALPARPPPPPPPGPRVSAAPGAAGPRRALPPKLEPPKVPFSERTIDPREARESRPATPFGVESASAASFSFGSAAERAEAERALHGAPPAAPPHAPVADGHTEDVVEELDFGTTHTDAGDDTDDASAIPPDKALPFTSSGASPAAVLPFTSSGASPAVRLPPPPARAPAPATQPPPAPPPATRPPSTLPPPPSTRAPETQPPPARVSSAPGAHTPPPARVSSPPAAHTPPPARVSSPPAAHTPPPARVPSPPAAHTPPPARVPSPPAAHTPPPPAMLSPVLPAPVPAPPPDSHPAPPPDSHPAPPPDESRPPVAPAPLRAGFPPPPAMLGKVNAPEKGPVPAPKHPASVPAPAAPATPAAPEAPAPPIDPKEYPITLYGAISAELMIRRGERARVLDEHRLSEPTWARIHAHWTGEMGRETARGESKLLAQFDEAYVETMGRLRKPIGVPEYAMIQVAIERGAVDKQLAALSLSLSDLMRVQRVWTRRIADEPELGKVLGKAIEEARAAAKPA